MDQDDPTSPNSDLYYTLVSQIPNKQNVAFFQINHQTGEISTTEQGDHFGTRDRNPDVSANCVCDLSIAACNLAGLYSTAVNPDYTAHRVLKIKVRLPERDVSLDCSDHEEVDRDVSHAALRWQRRHCNGSNPTLCSLS